MLVLKNVYGRIFFLLSLVCAPLCANSNSPQSSNNEFTENEVIDLSSNFENDFVEKRCTHRQLTYYLFISDFIASFIEIPTSNVSGSSTTIDSSFLAGRASLYDKHDVIVGNCSASFLNMQNASGIFTDISNYLTVDNGLVISWLTPTTLINLELDSIVHSMVTECIVLANTKIGFNPYYGKKFNMIVSSDDEKIYFQLTEI